MADDNISHLQPEGASHTDPAMPATANVARMYDYFLGGKDHLYADRVAAREVERRLPQAPLIVRVNRRFLIRTVTELVKSGYRQFVDIGSGLPTGENVHQVVRRTDPDARVAYFDNDPVVVSHGRALLETDPNTRMIEGDLRDPVRILRAAEVWGGIDWSRPVAVLMVAILHFIGDEDDPHGIVEAFREAMAPGSALTITHAELTPEVEAAARVYDKASSPATPRTAGEVARFFGDFCLTEPGLRRLRAEVETERKLAARISVALAFAELPWLAGVGVKRGGRHG